MTEVHLRLWRMRRRKEEWEEEGGEEDWEGGEGKKGIIKIENTQVSEHRRPSKTWANGIWKMGEIQWTPAAAPFIPKFTHFFFQWGSYEVRKARWDWNGFKSLKDLDPFLPPGDVCPIRKKARLLTYFLKPYPKRAWTLRLKHEARRVRQKSKAWGGVSLQNTRFQLLIHPAKRSTYPHTHPYPGDRKAHLRHQPAQNGGILKTSCGPLNK